MTVKPQEAWIRVLGLRRMLGAWLCGLVMLLGGCDGDNTSVEIGPTLFEFDRYLTGYTAVDTYPWDTTLRQAFVTTTLQNFSSGNVTIRLYDGNGDAVYTQLAVASSVTNSVGSRDYVVSDLTQVGTAGKWQVELRFEQFTGNLHVRLEQP